MNTKFLKNSRGQLNNVLSATVGIIVVFVALSLGMTLVSNFQGNLAAHPENAVPLNSIWPLAVAGVAIIGLLLVLVKTFS